MKLFYLFQYFNICSYCKTKKPNVICYWCNYTFCLDCSSLNKFNDKCCNNCFFELKQNKSCYI